jgi:hypothetical protein
MRASGDKTRRPVFLEIQLAEAVTNSRIARDKNLIGMRYPQGELWYREIYARINLQDSVP